METGWLPNKVLHIYKNLDIYREGYDTSDKLRWYPKFFKHALSYDAQKVEKFYQILIRWVKFERRNLLTNDYDLQTGYFCLSSLGICIYKII